MKQVISKISGISRVILRGPEHELSVILQPIIDEIVSTNIGVEMLRDLLVIQRDMSYVEDENLQWELFSHKIIEVLFEYFLNH